MIRNAILAPLTRAIRPRIGPFGALESLSELALFAIGWALWPLDWLVRLPALAMHGSGGLSPGRIACRGALLVRADAAEASAQPAAARATMLLRGADALLREHGIELSFEPVRAVALEGGVEPPPCGLASLVGRFFGWASARAVAPPALTVYFVERLAGCAGCAIPGADWIVVDLGTDATTIVHEIGHLADLWPHSGDPDNVMTNRPGGRHDRLTRFQAGMIRTSRYATGVPPAREL